MRVEFALSLQQQHLVWGLTAIRKIVHWRAPSTLEQYVQELGRAGRDNSPSDACILYSSPGRHVDGSIKLCREPRKMSQATSIKKLFVFFKH